METTINKEEMEIIGEINILSSEEDSEVEAKIEESLEAHDKVDGIIKNEANGETTIKKGVVGVGDNTKSCKEDSEIDSETEEPLVQEPGTSAATGNPGSSGTVEFGMYRCHKCHLYFNVIKDIKCHWFDVHGFRTPAECKICKIPFPGRGEAARHKLENHGYRCNICNSSFKKSMGLEDHTLNVHGHRLEYPCHICGFIVHGESHLLRHVMSEHGANCTFTCGVCGKRFVRKDQCDDHEEIHNNPVNCEFCNEEFPRKSVLQQHKRDAHPSEHENLKRKAREEKNTRGRRRFQHGNKRHRYT